MALALALAGVPVWLLTRSDTPPVEAPDPRPAAKREVLKVRVTSSAPALIKVSLPDRTLIDTKEATGSADADWEVDSSAPDDLLVRAEWTGTSTPQALRVEIVRDREVLKEQTLWGKGSIEDVVTPPAL